MSEIKVSKLTNRAGTGAPDFSQGVKISGTASTLLAPTRTESATEPTSPSNGDTWYDTDNDTYDVYMNDEWKRFIGASAAAATWYGARGIVGGGWFQNTIQYFGITTASNGADFGDLTMSRGQSCAVSNGSRCVWMGGYNGTASQNVIDYVTSSTTGNATDFGDLTAASHGPAGNANGTYGLAVGGTNNVIDSITIATTGNATDFGDTVTSEKRNAAGFNDTTRGVQAGGYNGTANSTDISYITMATAGNATDFGDTTIAHRNKGGASNSTRGVYGTGTSGNGLEYVTIQTTGNATDFGDLITSAGINDCCGDNNLAVFHGFANNSWNLEVVTIDTTGNATDHGDLNSGAGLGFYHHNATSGAAS